MAQVTNSFAPEKNLKYIYIYPRYSNIQLPTRNGHKCNRNRHEY